MIDIKRSVIGNNFRTIGVKPLFLLVHVRGLKILVSLVRFRDRAPLFLHTNQVVKPVSKLPDLYVLPPSDYFRISFPNTFSFFASNKLILQPCFNLFSSAFVASKSTQHNFLLKLSSALHSWGFEPKHTQRLRTHTPANTHFQNFVNALKRVKTPSKIHQKYTNLNMEAFA